MDTSLVVLVQNGGLDLIKPKVAHVQSKVDGVLLRLRARDVLGFRRAQRDHFLFLRLEADYAPTELEYGPPNEATRKSNKKIISWNTEPVVDRLVSTSRAHWYDFLFL